MMIDEFVLARVAEDEAAAQAVLAPLTKYGYDSLDAEHEWRWVLQTHPESGGWGSTFWPGAPSPERVLAECAAKRALVAAHPVVEKWLVTNRSDDQMLEVFSDGQFHRMPPRHSRVVSVRSGEDTMIVQDETGNDRTVLQRDWFRENAVLQPPPLELRILAAVYAEHPDYREEWKP